MAGPLFLLLVALPTLVRGRAKRIRHPCPTLSAWDEHFSAGMLHQIAPSAHPALLSRAKRCKPYEYQYLAAWLGLR